jgi:hypothetical protein
VASRWPAAAAASSGGRSLPPPVGPQQRQQAGSEQQDRGRFGHRAAADDAFGLATDRGARDLLRTGGGVSERANRRSLSPTRRPSPWRGAVLAITSLAWRAVTAPHHWRSMAAASVGSSASALPPDASA